MTDIDDEDFIKYGIFPELYGPVGGNKTNYNNNDTYQDSFAKPQVPTSSSGKRGSDFSFSNKKSTKRQAVQQPQKFMEQDEVEEDAQLRFIGKQQLGNVSGLVLRPIQRQDPDMDELMKGIENLPVMTIESRPTTNTVISYTTRLGASLLLNACDDGEISLSEHTLTDLQRLFNCDDEFTMIDPPIVIHDTLSTGTCNIYCKEVVRVSLYLLACHFKCTWTVELLPEQESNPKLFSDVQLKPYHNSNTDYAQPFNCEHIVMNHLKSTVPPKLLDEKLRLLQIHMIRLGHLTSEQAIDPEFIETQLQMLPSILNKQKVQQSSVTIGKDLK